MTGESLYPRDLIERLRSTLDRLEKIASTATVQPQQLIEALGTVSEANAKFIVTNRPDTVLRTIQAHRKILDRHSTGGQSPWTGDMTRTCVSCFQRSPCEAVRDLASIYFPESTTEGGS